VTNKDLEKLIKYWQPRLKLKDWHFEIRFAVDNGEIEEKLKSGFARTHHSPMSKKARILVKPSDKISKDTLDCVDIEVTVVHEMLHMLLLPIDSFKDNELSQDRLEHIIETLALALVQEKRKKEVK
jgi:hypothetical protein